MPRGDLTRCGVSSAVRVPGRPGTWDPAAVAPALSPTAVTMAYVSAGTVGAGALFALTQVVGGDAGVQSWLFLLTVPGVVGLVAGAAWLRRRLLVLSGAATAAVLLATVAVGLVAYQHSVFVAFAAGPLVLVPLPVVTAFLAASRPRQNELAGRR